MNRHALRLDGQAAAIRVTAMPVCTRAMTWKSATDGKGTRSRVAVPDAPPTAATVARIERSFHDAQRQRFGYEATDEPLLIVREPRAQRSAKLQSRTSAILGPNSVAAAGAAYSANRQNALWRMRPHVPRTG